MKKGDADRQIYASTAAEENRRDGQKDASMREWLI